MNIDYSKSINEQEILRESRVILSLIYRDYICLPEKRKELLEIDRDLIKKDEEVLREKYKVDFNKRNQLLKERSLDITKNLENILETNNVYLEKVKKDKWYKIIVNRILSIFKLKK